MSTVKQIICPCGHLLRTTAVTTSGGETRTCPCCKRKVKITITPTKVYTAYIR